MGESGLLARLCIPLAGLAKEDILITGEKTLLRRRLDDHRNALRELGLRLEFTDRCHLPVVVKGRLHAGDVTVAGEKGSQMISGMLLALSQCEEESSIQIEHVTSEPYISLTTYIASFFGLTGYECPELSQEDNQDDDEAEDTLMRNWYIEPKQKITPVQGLEVERDWSAAAMVLTAGAIAGEITVRGLDPYSCQSDAAIYDLFKGNNVDIEATEGKSTLTVRKSILRPFFFDITDAPDLFAPLFLLAVFSEGESVIVGIDRLKNKESNRAASFADEFRKMGVQTATSADQMIIYGHRDHQLRGAAVSSHGDHRLAMALLVASLYADGPVEIDDTDCLAKSFPEFLEIFHRLKR